MLFQLITADYRQCATMLRHHRRRLLRELNYQTAQWCTPAESRWGGSGYLRAASKVPFTMPKRTWPAYWGRKPGNACKKENKSTYGSQKQSAHVPHTSTSKEVNAASGYYFLAKGHTSGSQILKREEIHKICHAGTRKRTMRIRTVRECSMPTRMAYRLQQ